MPINRFQTMLLRNIQVRSCSQALMLNPIVLVKKVGRKTRNPNWGVVLIIRTTRQMVVFGSFHAIVTLERNESRGRTVAGRRRRDPVTSEIPKRAMRPPMRTKTSAHQRVTYWPTPGIKKLASNEPSVGKPPENANQYQPTAEPRRFGDVAAT